MFSDIFYIKFSQILPVFNDTGFFYYFCTMTPILYMDTDPQLQARFFTDLVFVDVSKHANVIKKDWWATRNIRYLPLN